MPNYNYTLEVTMRGKIAAPNMAVARAEALEARGVINLDADSMYVNIQVAPEEEEVPC